MEALSLFAYTINQTVGVGVLGMPYAFQQSGIFYSFAVLLFCIYMGYYVGTITVELIFQNHNELEEGLTITKPAFFDQMMNKKYSYLFSFLLITMTFGMNVAYFIVFASSLSANISLPYLSVCDIYENSDPSEDCILIFRIYLTIYAGIIYFLVVIGIREQKYVQLMLTGLRLLLFFSIISISLYRILSGEKTSEVTFINFDQFELSYTTIIFAVIYQHTLPALTKISKNLMITLPKQIAFACLIGYGSLGLITSIAFANVERSCNLSFSYLEGFFGNIFKSFIILAPAIDVIGTSPVFIISSTENTLLSFDVTEKKKIFIFETVFCALLYFYSFFFYNIVSGI